MRHLFIALGLAAALVGCETVENPVSGKVERTVMDERAEITEGQKAHPQILAEFGEYKNPRVQAYVSELGQRLARSSHRSELQWHFTVLDSPVINAFAVPGGYIYVTRGLMAYMNSEADLAGVIGHEIGHVTARHSAQRATRQQTAGLGVLAATILGAVLEGRGVGGAGDMAAQLSQNVAAGYIAHYSREQELESDRLGAEYLARANLDPSNMVDVIRVLHDQERFEADLARAQGRAPRTGADWLSSHPSNEQRLRDVTAIVSQYKGRYADDGRARYLQAINGMPFGESREQGLTRGRNFFHEPLGIALTAPQGWKIQNTPEAVALINGEGSAGLIMQLAPAQAGNTHEDIIRNLIKPDQGRTERLTLNGLPATHFSGTRQTQQGQRQPVEATIVTGPANRHFVLLYAAKDPQTLQRSLPELRQAEQSFRPMTAADRSAARPWTLRTVSYPGGGFRELARRSPLPNAEQQLRLLNGVYAGGEPQAGQPVKIVE
ncbi:M48 family metalloprotease [Piscinibacter sp.]|uniref:M48 family metalloprotease n=1 Tax=Piscinibacter sp. TaxID=1903157 RepID=UPI002BF9D05E|nr:M48 family metalloprotease [Albitalea sp.]HUG25281.1 M48 family metalloprotease [Albitalea sp.]